MTPLVRIAGVHKYFTRGSERIDVLKGVNLDVPPGDFLIHRHRSMFGMAWRLRSCIGRFGFLGPDDLGSRRFHLEAADRTTAHRPDGRSPFAAAEPHGGKSLLARRFNLRSAPKGRGSD